jgi:hypothetical protein
VSALFTLIVVLIAKYTNATYTEIPYEKVTQYEFSLDDDNINYTFWFTIRDELFNGWFTNDYLTNMGIDISNIEFDYNKYTYVITIGYELHRISYSYSDMKNRKFGFVPKQFVGKVELQRELKNIVYIYRIKRMDIDCDYHERNRNVFFVD